jgi:hypothetical protein
MVRRLSDVLKVSHQDLEAKGVFDSFLDIDSKLYIDPHLMANSNLPEMREAYAQFRKHFENVISVLTASKRRGDIFWRKAARMLIFHEIPQLGLGYSNKGTRGSAIGFALASELTDTAKVIIDAGIRAPEIFELMGLIEEGIGADRISDMVAAIVIRHLHQYSQRMADELSIDARFYTYGDKEYRLPFDPISGRRIFLLPQEILRALPIANDWSDIDEVCSHNAALRERVNAIIGDTWKKASHKAKRDLRETLLQEPEVLRDLIDQYKAKPADQYDFTLDPEGEVIWFTAAQKYSQLHPLDLTQYKQLNIENAYAVVLSICQRYKQLIEDNGLVQLLYNDKGALKHERAAQLLFFGIADAYCEANNLDLNREPNAGRGPVDFKLSRGYNIRINVEVKYSSNPKLITGYREQLPTYNLAEKTTYSIYLVLQTSKSTDRIDELKEMYSNSKAGGIRSPEIIVIDCVPKPSASKLR